MSGGGWGRFEMISSGQGGSMAEKIKFVTDFEAFFLGNWGGVGWGGGTSRNVPSRAARVATKVPLESCFNQLNDESSRAALSSTKITTISVRYKK